MNLNFRACEMTKWTKVAMVAMALILGPAVAQADVFDITTLPGYAVATSSIQNYNGAGGWGGWSVPTGKVVLGAKIISAGDSILDFSVFMPGAPGQTIGGYTFGVNEYGWRLRDNGLAANSGVQFELYYADPMAGYTITTSSLLNYSGTGVGGWSAPIPQVVSGGGYRFSNLGASASVSQIVEQNGNVAGYQYGPNEQGWTVQSAQGGGPANIYVISFDRPASVPDGGTTLALLGGALMGLAVLRRKFVV